MEEQIKSTDQTVKQTTIYGALAAAQAEFNVVVKNKVNPHFRSKYADIEAIMQAVRPALNSHGLFLSQSVTTSTSDVSVETMITHESGEILRSGVTKIPVSGGGNLAQAFGSAITYARRYSLSAFLGVSADDDDDGNGAGEQPQQQKRQAPPPPPPAQPSRELIAACQEAAASGSRYFQEFYQKLSDAEQKALTETGWKRRCWNDSKRADQEG